MILETRLSFASLYMTVSSILLEKHRELSASLQVDTDRDCVMGENNLQPIRFCSFVISP